MELKSFKLLVFTIFLIKIWPAVKVEACDKNQRSCDLSFQWMGCYGKLSYGDLEDIYNFELILKGNISQYLDESFVGEWKQSISTFGCECARIANEYNFTVFGLQWPSVCYGRREEYTADLKIRKEDSCERQNQSRPCSQSQSLCIGLKKGVSIYSIVKKHQKDHNYYTCHSTVAPVDREVKYKSSFSREESKQTLRNIFSMLNRSIDVDEMLNLIKEAIDVLKRPVIYQDHNVYKEQQELFVDILSVIVDAPFKKMWRKSKKIDNLVTLVENVAKTLLLSMEFAKQTNGHYHYPTPNIEIMGNFTEEEHGTIDLNDTTISIAASTVRKGPFGNAAILYKGIHDMFPTSKQRSKQSSGRLMKVASPVVSIIAMHDGKTFHQVNGTIRFKVIEYEKIDLNTSTSSLCVYWNENKNLTVGGAWSTRGLTLIDTYQNSNHSNALYYTCQTNHLTSFAILMETSDYKISESDRLALEIITYVGCSISLLCLLLTIFTLPFLRLKDSRFKIHLHLCIALAAAQIVFLAGINAVDHKIPCMIVAILLHYLFTVAFLWMLVEGIHLYQKIVIAYEKKVIRTEHYYIMAWGIPFIIVGISVAVHREGYGTRKGCWLSLREGFRWSFIGPVLLIMMVNIIILIRVLSVMVNLRNDPLKKKKYTKIRMALKGVIILMPLLGLTWLFGLISVNSETVVFQYLFAIFNSLQGAFLFVFNYLINKEVRASFRRSFHRTTMTSL